MLTDANDIRAGACLEADLCVVGAGPAGLTLARKFVGDASRVICLDSGGLAAEAAAQALNEGEVDGDPYAGLVQTRHRQVGGTTAVWNTPLPSGPGAKYVPLDPIDFESNANRLGWPFDRAALDPYYEAAQTFCGLGRFAYDADSWIDSDVFVPADPRVQCAIYQFGPSQVFERDVVDAIASCENVRLLYHATGCALTMAGFDRRATTLEVASLSGTRFRVQARFFVLAGGAIENARLLLVSRQPGHAAPGDAQGWVGRCFMEHPRDRSTVLVPDDPSFYAHARFYDLHRAASGALIGGRLALSEEAIAAHGMINASLSLLPLPRPLPSDPWRRAGQLLRRWLGRRVQGGYGWSEVDDPARHYRGFQLLINAEQRPHPENAVRLGTTTDRFGIPRAKLQWRWRFEDQRELDRAKATFVDALATAGAGQLLNDPGFVTDPNAHHHAGTTRMHNNARYGVVDADLRVHGTDNLYVAGASVFPSAGFANPTLTIVALALRLASHLRQRLPGIGS